MEAPNLKDWTRRVFFGCVHVPYADYSAIRVLKDFIADYKPKDIVCLGDLISVDQVSPFPSDCEVDLRDEFHEARALLSELGVTHMLLGNHENRLQRASLVKPNMRKMLDPVTNLKLKEQGIIWRPYHNRKGVFRFGKLTVLHGWWWNEYAAKTHAAAYDCCMFVHTHRLQEIQPKHSFVKNTGLNIGCLCRLDLPYIVQKPPSGWAQGFGYCGFHKSGDIAPDRARLIGNNFIIAGRPYRRSKT